jgi:hypothetical protein
MKKKMASRPNVMLNESQTDQASFLRNEVFATFSRIKSRRIIHGTDGIGN